ncbi:MAG: hypothetical protein GQ581_07660 [Methyloprofundus sp.]|nr:hypothetical protein [Methyloprofundus sp.]
MESIQSFWGETPLVMQQNLLIFAKLSLLLIITLICINKLQQWLNFLELDNSFKLPPTATDKKKGSTDRAWLSTSLSYGLGFSIAGLLTNNIILTTPLWEATSNILLLQFWGTLIFYLLLMRLLKQLLLAVGELFNNPAVESMIEQRLGNPENTKTSPHTTALSNKLIHAATLATYTCIAWLLGFLLLIDLFKLQLLTSLTHSLLLSAGELLIVLLMLFCSFQFYGLHKNQDSTHATQSALVLICCILLATLIISGSATAISSMPWLLLLGALWLLLVRPDTRWATDLVAGLYLKLSNATKNEHTGFDINSLGLQESIITHHDTETQESIRNSALLSVCTTTNNLHEES